MRPVRIQVPGALDDDEIQPGDVPTEDDLRRAARYFEVHGLPVSLGKVKGCLYRCAQWSDGRPVMFAESTVHRSGREITEQAFRELIIAHKRGY